MLRRRQINAEHGGRRLRSIFDAFEAIRWPLERLAWGAEQRLLWPLQERLAGLALPGRTVGAVALVAVVVGAVAFGAVWTSGDGDDEPVAAGAPVAATAPAPPPAEEQPIEPALHGVPPRFGVEPGVGVAGATGAEAEEAEGTDAAAVADALAGDEEDGATTSSQKPVPAGPAAMKVARRFTEAFVRYEIGERPARAVAVFSQTATPNLATALAERPPRQPEGAEVPKARVLNLVPGPRRGKAYTVSASLLRVGVTSELRLELARKAGAWRVTDVRG